MTITTQRQEMFIPKGSLKITPKTAQNITIALFNDKSNKPCALAFTNKLQRRPAFQYRFNTVSERDNYLSKFITSRAQNEAAKRERREAQKAQPNPCKVGDILSTSWGYDQTNVEFYQVVAVKGKSVTVREIRAAEEATSDMSGRVMPVRDAFCGEEFTRRVIMYSNGYYFNAKYSTATPWDGKAQYVSHYA